MGRLTNVPSRLDVLPNRLARPTDSEGHYKDDVARGWYHLAEWKHPETGLRMRVFRRDHFTCQWPGCGKVEVRTSKLVADHKRPHRGNRELFFDEGNVWTLCKPHHDSAKQAAERRGDWG